MTLYWDEGTGWTVQDDKTIEEMLADLRDDGRIEITKQETASAIVVEGTTSDGPFRIVVLPN